ncbi:hypothetical protein O4H49_20475 [Kiloniella laminariae]|uniref:Bacteriocin immunity protein n=1 Tax=Kiloniella laminariae TaxID=454162 RepID=A0ABT4LPV5_9PROT|nr:hypothetical protein [Kiloniella laminariae]MCZ4283165.1 hypothetical protein [Kiloniella laminariae]
MKNELEIDLLNLLTEIKDHLCVNGQAEIYQELQKSINILISNNKSGYKNLSLYILNDFRKLYDNRHDTGILNKKFDLACKLAKQLSEDS